MQKNVQIIDGAQNCSYSVFSISKEYFDLIFPNVGQDIEFIEEFILRVGPDLAGIVIKSTWNRALNKKHVRGIHGTLFYDSLFKKKFYPNKMESDLDEDKTGKA